METPSSATARQHRRILGGTVIAVAIAAVTLGLVATVPSQASANHARPHSSRATLQERKVAKFGEVLTNSAGYTMYVLSAESTGKLHCTSSTCLKAWPPVLVAKNAKITAGAGVKGKVSHLVRGSKWQVTYNGWPVYRFKYDSGPAQARGEGIHNFGGVWYLVRAAATTKSATPVKLVAGGTTTTTTKPSGGYGY